ncbi:MAG TPA: DUF4931 domain-containing protein [Candidatus Thermoplasmatota archaeon]|nr:DUF4931 domain-containing protein [Candidatus Thermoplasmatota archaeon]
MVEYREDPVTGVWVLYAPQRAKRPQGYAPRAAWVEAPPHDPACPFCPGNEHLVPPEVERVPGPSGGWALRSVWNGFPVFRDPGVQEVIVDHARHDLTLATMSREDVRVAMGLYRRRLLAARSREDVAAPLLFRNEGSGSGASQRHPHAQLVGLPTVPGPLETRWRSFRAHHDREGMALLASLREREREARERVLFEDRHVIVFAPRVSRASHEIWVVPQRDEPCFEHSAEATREAAADALSRASQALTAALGPVPCNLVLHTAPKGSEKDPGFVWYLEVVPRILTPGGFELATGVIINETTPEAAATRLRAALGHQH